MWIQCIKPISTSPPVHRKLTVLSSLNFRETKQGWDPAPTRSGLLADSMGLGKTLCMLSAVVSTLDEACRFEFVPGKCASNEKRFLPTRATLIVVPSARRLEICWPSKN